MRSFSSPRTLRAQTAATIGLTLALSAVARPQASPEPPAPVTFRVSSDTVLVDALVLDKRTEAPIGGLTAQDFRISEDGVPQRIDYFSRNRLPLSVVFLFDLTDSVRPALHPLAVSAREVLGHLKPQDEIAVVTFSSHTDLLQGFTTDHALAAAAIQKASTMKSEEATFIFEDVWQAAAEAEKATLPNSRRVLVFFTDGTANLATPLVRKCCGRQAPVYLHNRQEATERLFRSDAAVAALIEVTAATRYMLALDVNPLAWASGFGVRVGDIRHLADKTGGPVVHTSAGEAEERMDTLLDQLRDRYTLGYRPSASRPAGTFCRIRVQLTRAALWRLPPGTKAVVRARTGYYR
jgi:VWFA-related protein